MRVSCCLKQGIHFIQIGSRILTEKIIVLMFSRVLLHRDVIIIQNEVHFVEIFALKSTTVSMNIIKMGSLPLGKDMSKDKSRDQGIESRLFHSM